MKTYAKSSKGFGTTVSPHDFKPLRRFFNRARCRVCLYHESLHPFVHTWAPARPLGDKSLPATSYGQSERAA